MINGTLFLNSKKSEIYNPILPKSPTDLLVSACHLNTYPPLFEEM